MSYYDAMATPIFKTNLADVPNPTPLLLVAEDHYKASTRLYIMRSIQHLAKHGYNSFLHEQAPCNYDLYNNYIKKPLTILIKQHGKEKIESALMNPNKDLYYQSSNNAVLMWEANTHKIPTILCDDDEIHNNSDNIILNNNLLQENVLHEREFEMARLAKSYSLSEAEVVLDVVYAMYGQQTFLNYTKKIDKPADYLSDIALTGSKLRHATRQSSDKQCTNLKLVERNHIFADRITSSASNNPKFKGYGVFGYAHVAPIGDTKIPMTGEILREKHGIECVTVGFSNPTHIQNVRNQMAKSGIDITLLCKEEILPFSKDFFAVLPNEMIHVLNGNEITEGIHDVRDIKGLGLDYDIVLPTYSDEEYKLAVVKKIISKL